MADSKWDAYMEQAEDLAKTSGKEFKKLRDEMKTFAVSVRNVIKTVFSYAKTSAKWEEKREYILTALKSENIKKIQKN